MHLGAGTNVINTAALVIGETKSAGTLDFLGTTGTLTIAGQNGRREHRQHSNRQLLQRHRL